VLPHRQAAWKILAERLQELAGRPDRLDATGGLSQLGELADDLHGMAHDLNSAWTAASQAKEPHCAARPADAKRARAQWQRTWKRLDRSRCAADAKRSHHSMNFR
jgi:hypothetical protein